MAGHGLARLRHRKISLTISMHADPGSAAEPDRSRQLQRRSRRCHARRLFLLTAEARCFHPHDRAAAKRATGHPPPSSFALGQRRSIWRSARWHVAPAAGDHLLLSKVGFCLASSSTQDVAPAVEYKMPPFDGAVRIGHGILPIVRSFFYCPGLSLVAHTIVQDCGLVGVEGCHGLQL